jgi:hypothetical protein
MQPALAPAMEEKHPDSPGDEFATEALNEPTRESMEQLGRPMVDDDLDSRANRQDDAESPPGQNSDSLPQ